MSMQNYPSSAYFVSADKFNHVEGFAEALLLQDDYDTASNLLSQYLKSVGGPYFDEIIVFRDEDDISDNLERNKPYVEFSEDELYTKIASSKYDVLGQLSAAPTLEHFSLWG